MTINWICFALGVLLCFCSYTKAAPAGEDWSKFGELERTLKDLATTVLVMSGAGVGAAGGETADSNFGGLDISVLGSESTAALMDVNDFHI